MECLSCGNLLPKDAVFCNNCGKPVKMAESDRCPACGAVRLKDALFCGECGTVLNKSAVPPPIPVYPASSGRICPSCKREWGGDAVFCGECGATTVAIDKGTTAYSTGDVPEVAAGRHCGSCGNVLTAKSEFCGYCGAVVSGFGAVGVVKSSTDSIPKLKSSMRAEKASVSSKSADDKRGSSFFGQAGEL